LSEATRTIVEYGCKDWRERAREFVHSHALDVAVMPKLALAGESLRRRADDVFAANLTSAP
jgi:hypothetical protein